MTLLLDIQNACTDNIPVSNEHITAWVNTALKPHQDQAELTIRLVNTDEIKALNQAYRKQDKPTNVLAFPADLPDEVQLEHPFLGDIIICPAVLKTESITLNTPLIAHWAHIIIHGTLHLLGYDHIDAADARIMEALEITALNSLGFENPYFSSEDTPLD
jgi:probable rRNA maturation factor